MCCSCSFQAFKREIRYECVSESLTAIVSRGACHQQYRTAEMTHATRRMQSADELSGNPRQHVSAATKYIASVIDSITCAIGNADAINNPLATSCEGNPSAWPRNGTIGRASNNPPTTKAEAHNGIARPKTATTLSSPLE